MRRCSCSGAGPRARDRAALARSERRPHTLCAPGNAGIAREVEALPGLDPCDPAAVCALARERSVSLVVVGPEAPLVAGIADALADAASRASARAARARAWRAPRRSARR